MELGAQAQNHYPVNTQKQCCYPYWKSQGI